MCSLPMVQSLLYFNYRVTAIPVVDGADGTPYRVPLCNLPYTGGTLRHTSCITCNWASVISLYIILIFVCRAQQFSNDPSQAGGVNNVNGLN